MVWIILRRELLDALLGLRFQLVLLLTVLLMGVSGLLFPLKYQSLVDEYNQSQRRNLQGLERPAGRLVDLVSHFQILPMQPARLAFIAGGSEDQLPNAIEIAIREIRNPTSTGERNEFLTDLEDVDWTWLVQVLLSFAAIVLTFDALSGEKQNGTLCQTMANQVPRGAVLVGKYLAALIVVLIPLAVGLLVGLLMLMLSGKVGLVPGDAARVALFALIAAFYLSAVILLSLFVSARTSQPGTSLVVLLVIWTGLVAATPAVGGALLNSPFFSLRTTEEVRLQIEAVGKEVEAKHGLKRHWIANADDPATRKVIQVQREMAFAAKKVRDQYMRDKIGAVAAVRQILSISPGEAFVHACEGIAGTGLVRVEHFLGQVEEYRQTFEAFFQAQDMRDPDSPHLFYHPDYMSSKPVDVAQIPKFQERKTDWRQGLVSAAVPLTILILYNGLFFLGAYIAFLRYDIR